MLAQPGPMDERTIAGGAAPAHAGVPCTQPQNARLSGTKFSSLGAGVRDEPVQSLLLNEGRCMASLGGSVHARTKEMT